VKENLGIKLLESAKCSLNVRGYCPKVFTRDEDVSVD
jgi:hypothetical protein